MSDARTVADHVTDAVIEEHLEAVLGRPGQGAMLITTEGIYQGREEIAEFFRGWLDAFSEPSVEDEDQDGEEQPEPRRLVLELHQHRAARVTGETVPATGEPVTVRDAAISTVEGDVIVERHIYHDQVEMLNKLGLLME